MAERGIGFLVRHQRCAPRTSTTARRLSSARCTRASRGLCGLARLVEPPARPGRRTLGSVRPCSERPRRHAAQRELRRSLPDARLHLGGGDATVRTARRGAVRRSSAPRRSPGGQQGAAARRRRPGARG
ncbi:hypothetical protein HBB16_11630 [Pseudonocardia sp. MCCB 268]|nr:hypothetical protein [Pseudonocardia cytotoxica]